MMLVERWLSCYGYVVECCLLYRINREENKSVDNKKENANSSASRRKTKIYII